MTHTEASLNGDEDGDGQRCWGLRPCVPQHRIQSLPVQNHPHGLFEAAVATWHCQQRTQCHRIRKPLVDKRNRRGSVDAFSIPF